MQCVYIITFACKLFRYFLGIGFGACKDNSIDTGIKVYQTLQCFVALMCSRYIILMIYVFVTGVCLANGNFKWLGHVLLAYLTNFRRHGCAEQPGALTLGCVLQNELY